MKDTTRKVLRTLCALVFVCAVGAIIFHYVQEANDKKKYEDLQKQVKKEEPVKEEETQEPVETVEIPINFEELQAMNPDIYGWITIPGAKIDYPILQNSFNNEFYLDHTADGEPGSIGAIYTENLTSRDFTDYNTVIYGHNVPNGTMFRGLHEYESMDYMMEHPQVIIYTPEAQFTYEIYAAVVYDDRHILNAFDFNQESHRAAFLDSVLNARNMGNCIREDVPVTANDRLLTLSTCIKTQRDNRFIVGAVLVDEKKANNSVH